MALQRKPFIPRGPRREAEHRINNFIMAPEVRVVGDDMESTVMRLADALQLAKEREVDLVEINSSSNPPICRLTEYNKFLYEKKKKEKEIKAKAAKTVLKEIRFTPNTDYHDLDFKKKHAIKFLEEGAKVKIYVQFKGRAIVFKERGELLLLQFSKSLEDWGQLESLPNLEGKRMIAFLVPKKKKA